MPKDYHGLLVPGESYHMFNRAPGKEKMFNCAANYSYFLERLFLYTLGVAEYYSYCLLPNHFHLLTRIRPLEEVIVEYESTKNRPAALYDANHISEFIMERFSNAFNSYTKSFNKVNSRKGNLLMNYTKRAEVDSNVFLTKLIHYVHTNPVHHGLCKRPRDWKHSSFNAFYLEAHTNLLKEEVLSMFGGLTPFDKFHNQRLVLKLSLETS